MKTLLLWGVGDEFSQHLAYQLSLDGHRLLVTGPSFDKLQALDVQLCQSELHRFAAVTAPQKVAEWVEQQRVGLDGVLVIPPTPGSAGSLFVPMTVNVRCAEECIYTPLELLRTLLAQLRKGKRPKRVLVLLPWPASSGGQTPHAELLVNSWRHLITQLADELSLEGIHINALYTAAATPEPHGMTVAVTSETPTPTVTSEDARATIVPCATAVLAAQWFSETLAPLTGQFVCHPNPSKTRSASKRSL